MDDEKIFTTSDVVYANLDSVAKEQGRLHEAAICEVGSAAVEIAATVADAIESGMSLNEVMSL